MRCFWAVELPEDARDALAALQDELRGAAPEGGIRWVSPELLHLTLKFLGEVEDPEPVVDAVRGAVTGVAGFELQLGAPGTFGGRSPRVVWVGVTGPGEHALRDLAARVEDGCAAAGLPREERPFRAHVTIGRARKGRRRARAPDLRRLGDAVRARAPRSEPPAVRVREVVLVQSALGQGEGGQPVYSPAARVALS